MKIIKNERNPIKYKVSGFDNLNIKILAITSPNK